MLPNCEYALHKAIRQQLSGQTLGSGTEENGIEGENARWEKLPL
jgi:hypothetical protein